MREGVPVAMEKRIELERRGKTPKQVRNQMPFGENVHLLLDLLRSLRPDAKLCSQMKLPRRKGLMRTVGVACLDANWLEGCQDTGDGGEARFQLRVIAPRSSYGFGYQPALYYSAGRGE